MELNRYKIIFLLLAFASTMQAQRFVDETFGVDVANDVVYATNISVLTGMPDSINLAMDIYTPTGDTETDRPLVVIFHTGSFLPQYFNNQITGGKRDSAVVEMTRRLVRRGYVVAAADYRQGWNPISDDQNVRTGTLLNAAYRGIQDARACVRFFRNTVENESNPWGVDPERIVLFGFGTGGFLSLGAGYLDRDEELNLEKFIDPATASNFVNFGASSNVNGDTNTPLNIANNPGFSNDIAMVVSLGGALGDESWVEGLPNEPVAMGFHSLQNPFTPFAAGAVRVPVTNNFVVNVVGTREAVGLVNGEFGGENTNAVLDGASELSFANTVIEDMNSDFLNGTINVGGQDLALSTENFYPFLSNGNLSGPWDYVDVPTLFGTIDFINNTFGTALNADSLLANSVRDNPSFSRESGLMYLDTITDFFVPRAFLALNLETVGVNEIPLVDAGMTLSPNPASGSVKIVTDSGFEMKDIGVYNLSGKLVQSYIGINTTEYFIQKKNLPTGMYLVKARFEDGIQAQKIMFE